MMEVTEGHLLGGRIRYAQPKDGYRTGIEPVLLAASVPAQEGQTVLEAGTGAGAGLLCLLARVPGVSVIGVEIDPAMAELARRNLAANGFSGKIVTGDVLRGGWTADHVMANPPWHDERSTASPIGRRRLAKQESGSGVAGWIAALAATVAGSGTLTLILPAERAGAAEADLAAEGFGLIVTQPLLPKIGRTAKLALVQARRGSKTIERGPGLVLHEGDGRFTTAIDSVLRAAAPLPSPSEEALSRWREREIEESRRGEETLVGGVLDDEVGGVDHVAHRAGALVEHVGVEVLRTQLDDPALPGGLFGLGAGEFGLQGLQLRLADRGRLQAAVALGGAPQRVGDQAEEQAWRRHGADRLLQELSHARARFPCSLVGVEWDITRTSLRWRLFFAA